MRISYCIRRVKFFLFFIGIIIIVISLLEFFSHVSAYLVEKFLNHKYQGYRFQVKECKYFPFQGITLLGVNVVRNGNSILKAEKVIVSNFKDDVQLTLTSASFSPRIFKLISSNSVKGKVKSLKVVINNSYMGEDLKIPNGFIFIGPKGINFYILASYKMFDFNLEGLFSRQGLLWLDSPSLNIKTFGVYFPNQGNFNGRVIFRQRLYPLSFAVTTSPSIVIRDITIDGLKIKGPLKLKDVNNITSSWQFNSGRLNLQGELSFQNHPQKAKLYLKLDKTNILGIELLTNIACQYLKFDKTLELKTVGSVVNAKPFPELVIRLKFLSSGISIENLKYQAGFTLTGFWHYGGGLNLRGEFDNFSLSELLYIFFPQYQRVLSLAGINGRLLYFTFQNSRFTELYWEIPSGKIGDINFTTGRLHLIGNTSVLEFVNSQLVVNDTPYALEGNVDFSQFPSRDMWKDVYLVSVSPTVAWRKFGLERDIEGNRISLGTKLSDIVRLDYNVEFSDEGDYNKNEVSLEIKGTPNLKLRLRGNEEIMGVEKKVEF